jgi:hypothetical protein
LIAAETTGRTCFAVELDPLYIDVAIRRWQAFTGKAATSSDDRTFDQVAVERTPAGLEPANGSQSSTTPAATRGAAR